MHTYADVLELLLDSQYMPLRGGKLFNETVLPARCELFTYMCFFFIFYICKGVCIYCVLNMLMHF